MAMIENSNEFESWLCKKLADLEIDPEVYGSYITGILEEEDEEESKREALEGILGSFMEDPANMCDEVLKKWKPVDPQNWFEKEKEKTMEEILAEHSAKTITEKVNSSGENTNQTSEARAVKQALLAKYGEVFDEVDEENPEKKSGNSVESSISTGLFKNVNAKAVTEAEKAKRDKQKEEAGKKKERDKIDREKQKLKKEERKEKEKKRTQKKEKMSR